MKCAGRAFNAGRHPPGLANRFYMRMDLWEVYELVRSRR